MTDKQLIDMLTAHLIMLHRIAVANGPVKCNGKPKGKLAIIANETEAAVKFILDRKCGPT